MIKRLRPIASIALARVAGCKVLHRRLRREINVLFHVQIIRQHAIKIETVARVVSEDIRAQHELHTLILSLLLIATTTNPATPSNNARRSVGRTTAMCPNPAEKRCPVSKARAMVGQRSNVDGPEAFGIDPELGPYECLDVRSNLESCGGCVPEGEVRGEDGGQDCTAIEHVSTVECVSGKCIIGKQHLYHVLSLRMLT
jgi:hypothetical protein